MQIESPAALRGFYARARAENGGAWPDFEVLIERLYGEVLSPGDAAVDGGACVGRHTIPMARRVGRGGHVYAIEPIPRLAMFLRMRSLLRQQVRVHQCALSNRSGPSEFLEAGDVGYSGLRPRLYPRANMPIHKRQVSMALLDDLVPLTAPVRFIKLDLEGGEFDALRGGERLIAAQRPVIVFEYDWRHTPGFYGFAHADLLAFFSRLEYRLFDILGVAFDDPALWEAAEVWYYTAVPRERGYLESL